MLRQASVAKITGCRITLAYGCGTSFQTMPLRYQAPPIMPSHLIAVLQGWDVTDQQVALQIDVAEKAGVAGILVAYTKIEQGWQPKIVKWK